MATVGYLGRNMKTMNANVALMVLLTISPLHGQPLPEAVVTKKEMVVTANPVATAAGKNILRRGGSAVDAMIAVQAVLGLVEPQSSGIGGGAFVVYHDAKSKKTTTFDAREKAPASANENRFAGLSFFPAWQSGLSVGVPGVPRLLQKMHRRYGRLPFRKLFRFAENLAKKGFRITERTSTLVAGLLAFNRNCDERLLFRDPAAFAYFVQPNCTAKPPGTLVKNPKYAQTLKTMAREGVNEFYNGSIAADIIAAVQSDLFIPGDISEADLANYDVVERPPICIEYRTYKVCGMGPPSSGGLAVGQILGILEKFDVGDGNPLDVETVHLFTQAGRLAYADRGRYVADADFVTVPMEGMLDKAYLASRAALIGDTDIGVAEPGIPPGEFDPLGPHDSKKNSGTSHVSIVDRRGNTLSMTTSIEAPFGNGVMVRGFFLNNQLTDFSFSPVDTNGVPVANRVQPNKRPRSSMSPTIVFDRNDRPFLVTGSPGGSRIIGYTAQSIMNAIDFGLDPQEAINLPHYVNRNGLTDLEQPLPGVTLDYDVDALAAELKEKGHSDPSVPIEERQVGVVALTSGLSIIQYEYRFKKKSTRRRLIGGADQRRDGKVGGR